MKTLSVLCNPLKVDLPFHAQDLIAVTVTGTGDSIILLSGFATDGIEVWQTTS
jgi:hypothetical protein